MLATQVGILKQEQVDPKVPGHFLFFIPLRDLRALCVSKMLSEKQAFTSVHCRGCALSPQLSGPGCGGAGHERKAGVLIAFATLALISGCNPPMAKVSGTVTLDNAPLKRGLVYFHPTEDSGSKRWPAAGPLNAEGRYELTSAGARPGVQLGAYRVTVSGSGETSESAEAATSSRPIIPQQYADVDTTPLTATVVEGENDIDLTLQR